MFGRMHYHAPVHHCINLLSDVLCGCIFRGRGGKGISGLVLATLRIVHPCCRLLGGRSLSVMVPLGLVGCCYCVLRGG